MLLKHEVMRLSTGTTYRIAINILLNKFSILTFVIRNNSKFFYACCFVLEIYTHVLFYNELFEGKVRKQGYFNMEQYLA